MSDIAFAFGHYNDIVTLYNSVSVGMDSYSIERIEGIEQLGL